MHCCWLHHRTLLHWPPHVQHTMLKRCATRSAAAAAPSSSSPSPSPSPLPPGAEEKDEHGNAQQLEEGQFFNPDYLQVERIISCRGRDSQYLVKWRGLGYEQATWELPEDIRDDAAIARYHLFSTPPQPKETRSVGRLVRSKAGVLEQVQRLQFKGDRQLREYQVEGVSWMAFNWTHERPSLLADEMVRTPAAAAAPAAAAPCPLSAHSLLTLLRVCCQGLGKTAQAIGLCRYLHEYFNDRGPWLVVCPLSTAVHWQREFEAWTDFNAVIYHGTQEARAIIEEHEFRTFELKGRVSSTAAQQQLASPLQPCPDIGLVVCCPAQLARSKNIYRFNALIVPDSIVVKDAHILRKSQPRLTDCRLWSRHQLDCR